MTHFRPLLLAVFVIAAFPTCSPGFGQDRVKAFGQRMPESIEPCDLRLLPEDEIWLLSSRCIETCTESDLCQLQCLRWCAHAFMADDWRRVVAEHQQRTDKRTVIYLHGNRTNLEWSEARGLQVFNAVFGSELNRPPVRFVVWSWPADPQIRRRKEYKKNSQRSVWESDILAEFITALGNASPIGLFGYSFGAQSVVFGAEKACERARAEGRGPIDLRIASVAPALQKPWSQVSEPLAGCADCVTYSIELTNSQDRALRVHYFVSRIAGPNYAASTSVDELSAGSLGRQYLDVGDLVGKQHNVVKYTSVPFVADSVRAALLAPTETEIAPAQ